MLSIKFGAAKVNKYASRESGDTLEIVERPLGAGGLTAILVDGQGSGHSAKALSNFIAAHCAGLVKQGIRDGVVARAANDLLYNSRNGQVSASLNLLSVDLATRSLVVSRNNPQPAYVRCPAEDTAAPELQFLTLDEPSVVLGSYPRTRPVIREFELAAGLLAVCFTDGLAGAGERYRAGQRLDIAGWLHDFLAAQPQPDPQELAGQLLEAALEADRRMPQDDISVVALAVEPLAAADGAPVPRRMRVEISAG